MVLRKTAAYTVNVTMWTRSWWDVRSGRGGCGEDGLVSIGFGSRWREEVVIEGREGRKAGRGWWRCEEGN